MLNLYLYLVGAEGYDFSPKLFLRWMAAVLKDPVALAAVAVKYDFEDELTSILGVEITQEILNSINDKVADTALETLQREFSLKCHTRHRAGVEAETFELKDALVSDEAMNAQIEKIEPFVELMESAVMRNLGIDLDCAPQESVLKETRRYLEPLKFAASDEPYVATTV